MLASLSFCLVAADRCAPFLGDGLPFLAALSLALTSGFDIVALTDALSLALVSALKVLPLLDVLIFSLAALL